MSKPSIKSLSPIAFFRPVISITLLPRRWPLGMTIWAYGQLFALGLICQFVIGVDPRFGLGLAGFGALAHPLQFALQCLLARFVFAGFLQQAFGFLLEPGGIVALPWNAAAAVEFQNPSCDGIEEVAVVGDDQDGAFVIDQVLLQPGDRFSVEVVGRFIKQKHIRRFKQQLAQGHAAGFTAGQIVDVCIIRQGNAALP